MMTPCQSKATTKSSNPSKEASNSIDPITFDSLRALLSSFHRIEENAKRHHQSQKKQRSTTFPETYQTTKKKRRVLRRTTITITQHIHNRTNRIFYKLPISASTHSKYSQLTSLESIISHHHSNLSSTTGRHLF